VFVHIDGPGDDTGTSFYSYIASIFAFRKNLVTHFFRRIVDHCEMAYGESPVADNLIKGDGLDRNPDDVEKKRK